MFTDANTKIVKPEGQTPDEFELAVASELFNLQVRAHFIARFHTATLGQRL